MAELPCCLPGMQLRSVSQLVKWQSLLSDLTTATSVGPPVAFSASALVTVSVEEPITASGSLNALITSIAALAAALSPLDYAVVTPTVTS